MTYLLRTEGAALFAAAVVGYLLAGGSWPLFLLLFLAPDLSMAGYLAGPRIGAVSYNLFHATILPLGLLAVGLWSDWYLGVQVAAIWLAHIGFDRALGYGLKRATAFTDTHLGPIGQAGKLQSSIRSPG